MLNDATRRIQAKRSTAMACSIIRNLEELASISVLCLEDDRFHGVMPRIRKS